MRVFVGVSLGKSEYGLSFFLNVTWARINNRIMQISSVTTSEEEEVSLEYIFLFSLFYFWQK